MKIQNFSPDYISNLKLLPEDLLLRIKKYIEPYTCHGCLKISYFPKISQGKFNYCCKECYNFF